MTKDTAVKLLHSLYIEAYHYQDTGRGLSFLKKKLKEVKARLGAQHLKEVRFEKGDEENEPQRLEDQLSECQEENARFRDILSLISNDRYAQGDGELLLAWRTSILLAGQGLTHKERK